MVDNTAISFSRLFADAAQTTYKGLHALLDDLADADPETRRERILEFAIEKRHLFVRLLVTVRWHMNFSAFHGSARSSHALANSRSTVFVRDADSMHYVWATLRGATTPAPALQEAAEVMGASLIFDRLPRCIIDQLGLDSHGVLRKAQLLPAGKQPKITATVSETSKKSANVYAELADEATSPDGDVSREAVERIGALTRRIVTESLPKGVSIIQYSAPPEGAAVQIGVPGAWTANIILSELVLENAFFRMLQLQLLVDSHPDVVSSMRSPWRNSHRPVKMHLNKLQGLRQMLNDRMHWTIAEAASSDQKEERFSLALKTLSSALSRELCGKLVLAHIREELSVILSRKQWQQAGLSVDGRWAETDKNIPVQIRYWPKSHAKATVQISVAEDNDMYGSIVDIVHDPPLPAGEPQQLIDYKSVDAQKIILDAARGRARCELRKLQDMCLKHFHSSITSTISAAQQSVLSLVFFFKGHGVGLELAISLDSGGAFVSTKGGVQLALSALRGLRNPLNALLWKDERFFRAGGTKALWSVCEKILSECMSILRDSFAVRSMCVVGTGAIMQFPPGIPSVQKPEKGNADRPVEPPFSFMEPKRPRCFVSLKSITDGEDGDAVDAERPPAKRRRVQFNLSESDGLYFFESRLRDDHASPLVCSDMNRSARQVATRAELHQDIWLRLKRDKIAKMLAAHKLMPELGRKTSLSVSQRVRVDMRTMPLETDKTVLFVGNGDDWGLELTLTNDLFSHGAFHGYGTSYNARTRVLRFYYPWLSKSSVLYFVRDLMRARTAASVSMFLRETATGYKVLRRGHTHAIVELKGLRIGVGLGPSGMDVATWPKYHIFEAHLIPLMQELLMESRKRMGHSFAGLLHMAVPMGQALQMALPKDPSLYRLKFLTALWVRIAVGGKKNGERVTHCLEVDVRRGPKKVYVSDYGKYLRLRAKKGSKEANAAAQFAEMPKWELFVKQLVEKKAGRAVNAQGTTAEITMTLLGKFLQAVVKYL